MLPIGNSQLLVQEHPFMDPKIPPSVLDGIRRMAQLEWPGDFEQQIYFIDAQVEAWLDLVSIEEQAGDQPQVGRLLAELREEWPEDYKLQLYHLRAQIEARDALLQLERLHPDIPADVFATICKRALRSSPDDFEIMRISISNQTDAWRKLNAQRAAPSDQAPPSE